MPNQNHKLGRALLVAFFVVGSLVNTLAQGHKSAARILLEAEMKKTTIRAVIVGVSEYANFPEAQQLLYADDDAMQLYDFLKAKPEIDSSNIHVILNSEAHGLSIKTQLYRILFKESKPGDIVIFYFAGHGDVDATIEDGFLLMHDVGADGDYFISDALQVSAVQDMITTAGASGVKVLLITDACRSGKLVGDSRGALHTTAALVREWQNALKLVSCQADQGSMESERWGEGHGVFTFHLVNGLMGLADENKDLVVNFGEISDYVRSHVKKDTEYKQVPKSTGDETFRLFLVDTSSLAQAEKVMGAHRELFGYPSVPRGIRMRGLGDGKSTEVVTQLKEGIAKGNLRGSLYYIENDGSQIEFANVTTAMSHTKQVRDLCYDPELDMVITASEDNLLKVWNGTSLKLIKVLKKHKASVLCVEANQGKANQIASGAADNGILLWDIESGKAKIKIKEAHNSKVHDLVFTNDGKRLISCGDNKNINIWSTENGDLHTSLVGHSANVTTLQVSPKGELLASGSETGEVLVWDLSTGKVVKKLEGHREAISAIQFPKDENCVITSSKGESIAIWDLNTSQIIKSVDFHSSKEELLEVYNMNLLLRSKRGAISIMNSRNKEIRSNPVKSKGVRLFVLSTKSERAFWISGTGTLSSSSLKLPLKRPSVLDLYGELLSMDVSDQVKETVKSEVFSALVRAAEQIAAPFIEGATRLPLLQEVRESIGHLEGALKLYPSDELLTQEVKFLKLYLEVQEILLSNNYKAYPLALKKLDEVISLEPQAAYTYNTKAVIYQRLNKTEEAEKNASIAKEKTPNWSEPRNNLGKIYLESGDYQKAMAEYKGIIKIKPNSSKGYSNMGSIYHSLGDYKNAEKFYRESISVDSLNPEVFLKYSELQMSRGRYVDAEKLLLRSNILDSTDVSSLLFKGKLYSYLFQNDLDSKERVILAHRNLIRANEQFPNNPRTYSDLSKFYISTLERGSGVGVSHFYKVFKIESKEVPELIVAIATRVKSLCDKALELDPYSVDALDGLAFSTLYLTKGNAAENLYLKAIAASPNKPVVYCRYAKFCKNRDLTDKAAKLYNKAIELDPLYLLAYIELWSIYRHQDDRTALTKLYKRANKNFPNSPIFNYKRSILPGHKATRKEVEAMFEKDESFYHASVLAYNYNYKNLQGQPELIEPQQYSVRIKKANRINENYTIVEENDYFGNSVYGVMHASGMVTISIEYDTLIKLGDLGVLGILGEYEADDKPGDALKGVFWYNLSGDLLKYMDLKASLNSNGNKANRNNTYISTGNGCYDLQGRVIVPEEYDYIYHFDNGNRLIQVAKDGKYGCYNLNGELVIPIKYELISPGFSVRRTPGVMCKLGFEEVFLNYLGRALK